MSHLFKDIIPSILVTGKDVLDVEKDYVPYVVNRALSFHYDCIFYANEMNTHPSVPKRMQYYYLLKSVRKYKRQFQPWHKRETSEKLNIVKKYYKYSNEKAKEAISLLSDSQIDELADRMYEGGFSERNNKK